MIKFYQLFCLCICSVLFSQTILVQPETTSRTVEDPHKIVLGEGFKATSTVSNPFVAKINTSTLQNGGPINSTAGSNNPSGTVDNGTDKFHDTKGNIQVGQSGQLNFSLPIALPPGVKSVGPQVDLQYISGGGNGIAGYSWGVSGLSSISRISKNIDKYKDITGVKLDYTDDYSFNGQRLILKSGEYGKDGAEYVTEKFSSIKIKSVGSINGQAWKGPEYWEVTFEDGSQAWYGSIPNVNWFGKTAVEYSIVKWVDNQGNYIDYQYYLDSGTKQGGVLSIKSIKWGGNQNLNTAHFNEINFDYTTRENTEISYLQGVKFVQSRLLKEISVKSNNKLFKKYVLDYTNLNTGYNFIEKITEYNSNNEAANPITFTYDTLPFPELIKSTQYNLTNYKKKKYADFDLDGIPDYLEFVDSGDIKFRSSVYVSTTPIQLQYDATKFTEREFGQSAVVNYVKDGYIKKQLGLVVPIYKKNAQEVEFLLYHVNLTNQSLDLERSKVFDFGSIGGHVLQSGDVDCTAFDPSFELIPYDFDGDGISELMTKVSTSVMCIVAEGTPPLNTDNIENDIYKFGLNNNVESYEEVVDDTQNRPINSINTIYRAWTLIDLAENIPTNNSYYVTNFDNSKLHIADLDGDGVQELIPANSSFFSTPLNIKRSSFYNYSTTTVGEFGGTDLRGIYYQYALFGDYNGDGKTDILIPNAKKSNNWTLLTSNGRNFERHYVNNFIYFDTESKIFDDSIGTDGDIFSSCQYFTERYFQYSTSDLDGDGKHEVIFTHYKLKNHQWHAHSDKELTEVKVSVYSPIKMPNSTATSLLYNDDNGDSNIDTITSDAPFSFHRVTYQKNYSGLVIPFSILTISRDIQQIVLVGKSIDCTGDCNYNYVNHIDYPYVPKLSRLKKIKEGEIVTEVSYEQIENYANGIYQNTKDELYPYNEILNLPSSFVVSKLVRYATNNINNKQYQFFKYRGLITNNWGKGIVGFRQFAQSQWGTQGLGRGEGSVWNGVEIDPLDEALPIKNWSLMTSATLDVFPQNLSETNTNLLTFSSTEYKKYNLLNGQIVTTPILTNHDKVVKAIVPYKVRSKDVQKNLTVEKIVEYDTTYFLPTQTVENTNNGFGITTTNLAYTHNIGGVGSNYYVGRPLSQTNTVQSYNDTKTSKTDYTYENNLVKTSTSWNRNNSGFLKETYQYDGFGNIVEKLISNSVDDQTQKVQTNYDSKGRFVIKKKDNIGLETNISYNDFGQILTELDPLGNTITNEYDAWGKLLKTNHNLTGTTTYKYEKSSAGQKVTKYVPTGDEEISYINHLGQTYKSSAKGFASGSYISVEKQYDILGRETKTSEPYLEGSSERKWNTYAYDDTVFPPIVTATAFDGKKIKTVVSGLTTTVTELTGYNRITSKTSDALGNVIASTDKGGTINFKYNAAGDQIEAKYDTNSVTTKYDEWGRKSEFNDPSNGVYRYEYDAFGQPKKIISPKGVKEYTYNALGQLILQKEVSSDGGEATKKSIGYSYDDKGRLILKSGTSKNKFFSTSVLYDPQGRIISKHESSFGKQFLENGIKYDDRGRVTEYERSLLSSGITTKVKIQNVYNPWDGELYQVKDQANKVLWELKNVDAKGNVLEAKLGKTTINNTYDANNFLTNINHSSDVKPGILQISYNFNSIKNELNSRITGGDFNILENFEYDDNNRLMRWTNPRTGQFSHQNVYDAKGRIISNDQIGTIKFGNSTKIYQPTGAQLNAQGEQNYTNDLIQKIKYNENNDPTYIDGIRGDFGFQYGLSNMRQRMSYGGNFGENEEGHFTKYYSEDNSFEIIRDNSNGTEKHILYIGGTPYESNIVFIKNYAESEGSFKFLHKDYLGSILAISDEAGHKLEQRHYDAWGIMTHLQIGNGAVITDDIQIQNITEQGGLLLDRGYTSHEHLWEVKLIHMNGRLYDPLLRRFLNADENIQYPHNTQNYNKYGYVMNNPLMFNDPSGEFILEALSIIKLIGIAYTAFQTVKAAYLVAAGKISIGQYFKTIFVQVVSQAITFGIGELFKTGGFAIQVLGKSGAKLAHPVVHAVSQGILSSVTGSNFLNGFATGIIASLGAKLGMNLGGNRTLGATLGGAIGGGVGSAVTNGNFWNGVTIGATIGFFNEAQHDEKPRKDRIYKGGEIETVRIVVKARQPTFWSASANFAFFGGFGMSIGQVSGSYGRSKWFFSFNGNIGFSMGAGLESGNIYMVNPKLKFLTSDFAGDGASYNISEGPASLTIGGTMDNKSLRGEERMDPKNIGSGNRGYRTVSYGVGKGGKVGFPVTYSTSKTWVQ